MQLGGDGPGRSAPDDLAGLQARGANVDLAHGAGSDLCSDRLDVRVPTPMRPAMRVRDAHAETWTLATHVTHGSHAEHHLSRICDRPVGRSEQTFSTRRLPGNLPRVLTRRRGTNPHKGARV